ncbi:MAG: DUF479 domain-containing protein [Bacteroidia bacterium]|nr:DUF479 domain-containing protein [Bacteroidia bacterium]
MNYLAHAYLSNNNNDLLIGNFIADHVRGNVLDGYPAGIVEGIKLHRKIDTFTDEHPMFRKSKRIFYDDFEKHSGILVDIYFDYFLAKDFNSHSNTPLKEFSKNVYSVYTENIGYLPETSARFLSYVIKNNIYESYGNIEGISQVLFHLSHRIKHGVALQDSVKVLNEKLPEMQANFDAFFKDLKAEFIHD